MDDLRAVLRHREFRLLWGARAATSLGDRIVFIALALYVTDIGTPERRRARAGGQRAAARAVRADRRRVGGPARAPPRDGRHRHRARRAARAARGADLPRPGADLGDRGDRGRRSGPRRRSSTRPSPGWCRRRCRRTSSSRPTPPTSIVWNMAELVGPAIATVLVLGLGAGWAFTIDALAFVVSALPAHARPPALARGARAAGRAARRPAGRLARGPLAPVGVGRARGDVAVAAARARAVHDARADDRRAPLRQHRRVRRARGGARDRDAARLGRRAAPAAAPPDPLRDGVGHAVAAGVRPVRARAAAGAALPAVRADGLRPVDVRRVVGHGAGRADPAARAVAGERVRLHGLAGAAAARLRAGRAAGRGVRRRSRCWWWAACWRPSANLAALVTPGVWRLQNSPRPSSGVEASA